MKVALFGFVVSVLPLAGGRAADRRQPAAAKWIGCTSIRGPHHDFLVFAIKGSGLKLAEASA